MSAVNCGRPGCAGEIVDGYCDTCGLAQRTLVGVTGGASGGTAGGAAASGPQRCTRPGCTGTIQDGYCDTCGMAASPARSGSAPSARTGSTRGSVSTGRTSTGRTRGSAVSARTGASRSTSRSGSRSTGRGGLGLGLVEIPQVEYRDPGEAVLADPQVPEHKRYCSKCGAQVGRSPRGPPRAHQRLLRQVRQRATPSRRSWSPGTPSRGQYEVLGCLAHGGLGWIYLARDHNVSDRWVVLKGLLDTGDADAMAAAVAERQFLAEVEHPNIVKIYNFVSTRPRPARDGYIVMEYVGGKSLKQIALDDRDEHGGAAAAAGAGAGLRARDPAGASATCTASGLLYCDFKPDNVIQSEEQLKLIDMGAVRAIDDQDAAIYGTVGYQAPEIAQRRAVRRAPTCTPSAGRWPCSPSTSRATPPPSPPGCRRATRYRCSPSTSPSTGAAPRHDERRERPLLLRRRDGRAS